MLPETIIRTYHRHRPCGASAWSMCHFGGAKHRRLWSPPKMQNCNNTSRSVPRSYCRRVTAATPRMDMDMCTYACSACTAAVR
eukprot:scaffold18065_cov59-Phaeocystis_antarctica.AAC.9